MNPLMGGMGGMNIMQMLGQLMSNPMELLKRTKFNIPANMNMNNPQDIIQHLLNSGQLTQDQLNQAQQQARMFGIMK